MEEEKKKAAAEEEEEEQENLSADTTCSVPPLYTHRAHV